jgi:hypothetical protein
VLGPVDPQRAEKLAGIRHLLKHLPANEAVLFQDEVDVNSDPKIWVKWMRTTGHRKNAWDEEGLCGRQPRLVHRDPHHHAPMSCAGWHPSTPAAALSAHLRSGHEPHQARLVRQFIARPLTQIHRIDA